MEAPIELIAVLAIEEATEANMLPRVEAVPPPLVEGDGAALEMS